MSKDEQHADIDNKGDAWSVIRNNDSSQGGGASDNGTEATQSAQSASDGGHPKDDVPPADDTRDSQTGAESYELPCGHESVPVDQLPLGKRVKVTCDTCGQSWGVTRRE